MEIPRLVHDEILHKLEEPRDEQLLKEVASVAPNAKIVLSDAEEDLVVDIAPEELPLAQPPSSPKKTVSSEKTPLLMAGKHIVHVDADFDVKALAMKLTAEEKAAVFADLHTPAADIIREEAKYLIALMIPMMAATLLEFLPETVLSMMIGHTDEAHSTQILAAFSLSSLFQMLVVMGVLNGLGSAIDTMCSQAFGGKRYVELWMFIQAGAIIYVACIPFVAVALLNGEHILLALGQDPAIARIASRLLIVTLMSVPFSLVFSMLKSSLQAQNIVSPFVKTSLVSWAISLPIAYMLGFWTPLGFYGIALADVVNSSVKSIALYPIVKKNEVFVQAWPGWQFKKAIRLVPKICRLGVSSILMVTFQMAGFGFISLLAGLLPNADIMISANRIFAAMLVLSFMPLLGICIAGAIRIGNALGAGQARRAWLLSRVVMTASIAISTVGMFVTLVVAGPYSRSFTNNKEAVDVAMKLFHTLLPFFPLLGFLFGIQSVFRACGKQWLCAKLNFLFMFVISVPLGILLAMKLNAGIAGLWYGNFIGMAGFTVFGIAWLYHISWEDMAHDARRNTHLHVEQSASTAVAA